MAHLTLLCPIVNDEHHFHRFETQTGGAVATEELEEDAVATMTQAVQVQRLFLHQHMVILAARVETETTFRHLQDIFDYSVEIATTRSCLWYGMYR